MSSPWYWCDSFVGKCCSDVQDKDLFNQVWGHTRLSAADALGRAGAAGCVQHIAEGQRRQVRGRRGSAPRLR